MKEYTNEDFIRWMTPYVTKSLFYVSMVTGKKYSVDEYVNHGYGGEIMWGGKKWKDLQNLIKRKIPSSGGI